ncbi:DUF3854 domain-containing protein [Desulfofundulus thermocisternus]|jgi:hypothetical protein|uniref:DUF3854 domain-containing protein n=1 Tax=Desulfofundulus thermocisternus TaxID=42471 RepID=UPI00217D3135|nr:DUF3854 domain-containing protein [Desulfofundulus thermocisternus]MCS5696964.1 DUF3854 domain-containing protein [Desulfofundulus thermocisternus]
MFYDFDIVEIAQRMGITLLKQLHDGQVLARCPFCGDSRKQHHGHLYLRGETGEYICHRCGESGYAIGLYARLRGLDTKTAYKELASGVLGPLNVRSHEVRPQQNITPVEVRDQVYRALMNHLPLYQRHKQDLINRGLPENVAINYRSLPDDPKIRWSVCRKLNNDGISLEGIPGFYRRTNRKGEEYWDMVEGPGYLIPVRDTQGRITSLQIRRDPPGLLTVYGHGQIKVRAVYADEESGEKTFTCEIKSVLAPKRGGTAQGIVAPYEVGLGQTQLKLVVNGKNVTNDADWYVSGPAVIGPGKKYVWFSTPGRPGGAAVQSQPHVTRPGKTEKIWVTEGPLKADVAAHLLSQPFIGVPGINAWEPVREIASAMGVKEVISAYDNEDNPFTRRNELALARYLEEAGIKVTKARWDRELGKGIDDALVSLIKRHQVITESTFLVDEKPVTVKTTTTTEVEIHAPRETMKTMKQEGFLARLIKKLFGAA